FSQTTIGLLFFLTQFVNFLDRHCTINRFADKQQVDYPHESMLLNGIEFQEDLSREVLVLQSDHHVFQWTDIHIAFLSANAVRWLIEPSVVTRLCPTFNEKTPSSVRQHSRPSSASQHPASALLALAAQ